MTTSAPVVVLTAGVPGLFIVTTTSVVLIPPARNLITLPLVIDPTTKLPPVAFDVVPLEYKYASVGNKMLPKLFCGDDPL